MNNQNIEEGERDLFAGLHFTPVEEYKKKKEEDLFAGLHFTPVEEYEKEKTVQRTPFQQVGRRISRYAQRGLETVAGLPGDVVQTIRGLTSFLPGGVTPKEKLTVLERPVRTLLEALPGSAELRARSAEVRPELEPESRFEEIEDEVVGDFSALALPIGGRIPFAKALGLSVIGNLGKQVVKELGVGEGKQEATKLGLMLFTGMFGKGRGITKHIENLYKNASEFVPEGASFKYPMGKLSNVEAILKKGTLSESKEPVLKIVQDIKAKAPQGIIPVEEAVQFDKDINRAIGKSFADKTKMGYLKQLKSAHSEAMDAYAKENPSWGENWMEAKKAYQGMAMSRKTQNFIRKNTNLTNLFYAGGILGLEEMAIPGLHGRKLGALGLGAATIYAGEIAKRISTNSALRRYYANVISASLSENKAMLARNLAGLERTAKKEFEERPLRFPIFDIKEED